jgi:hypothetical protein
MKKLLVIGLIFLAGCDAPAHESDTEMTEVVQIATDTENGAKIATERVSETTEAASEIVTTEQQTEKTDILSPENDEKSANSDIKTGKKSELPGKMVFNSERKTAERVAVTTEETTGEIDADGYGWVQLQYSAEYHIREDHLTRSNGSIDVFGHHETWYSTNEGCGQTTAVPIPGKHVADDGTIRDEDGYICVASSDLKMYSIVMTSVGPGKVYDTGCSHGTIDVYTNW